MYVNLCIIYIGDYVYHIYYFFAFNVNIVSIDRVTTSALYLSSPDISRASIRLVPGGTEELGFRGPVSYLSSHGCKWETKKMGERCGLWP